MKKLLLAILMVLMFATPGWAAATNYFACNNAQNVTGDSTWCAYADLESISPAACTKAAIGSYTAWATITSADTLYANGCASVVINDSFTVAGISTADGGGGNNDFAGGTFTLATGTVTGKTITATVMAGTTPCVTISGSGAGTPVDTFVGNITGGTAANANGISSSHTVGTIAVTGNVTGGSTSSNGVYSSGSTGHFAISGDSVSSTGGSGYYQLGSAALSTIAGSCKGNDSSSNAGCSTTGAGTITVSGNLINGERGAATNGSVLWTPGPTNYIVYPISTSATVGTINSFTVVAGPIADGDSYASTYTTEAEIKSGKYIGTALGTMTSGGSGAWGF